MPKPRPAGKVTYQNRGRVILVTGGCGGIGSAICAAFARSGAAGVVAVDLPQPAKAKMPRGGEISLRRCDQRRTMQKCRRVDGC